MHKARVALLTVDWESGEGGVDIGSLLDEVAPRIRRDVLADWKARIDQLHAQAEAQLEPDLHERLAHAVRRQCSYNGVRRLLCERLGGQQISMAEPLVNGDVLLHLGNGKTVVLYARHEDVKVAVVPDVTHARRLAAADATGDYYLREESVDEPLGEETPRRASSGALDA